MKFRLCYTELDYFGQMKSNTASFNTIRRIDIAEFLLEHSAPTIRGLMTPMCYVAGKCLSSELWPQEVEGKRASMQSLQQWALPGLGESKVYRRDSCPGKGCSHSAVRGLGHSPALHEGSMKHLSTARRWGRITEI